jgi:uridine kinase
MRTRLIVGVSGGSGSGKHRVIHHHLLPALGGTPLILEHDWYYHEVDYLTRAQGVSSRLEINYDQPDAYENLLLVKHLRDLQAGRSIQVYPYQKANGMRRAEPMWLEPRDVVIVDGMMILAVPELVSMLEIRAYVQADDDLRLARRIARDLSFCSAEESELRFRRDVLPAHRRYVEPSRTQAHFVVMNARDGHAPDGIDAFVSAVLRALAEEA